MAFPEPLPETEVVAEVEVEDELDEMVIACLWLVVCLGDQTRALMVDSAELEFSVPSAE